MTIQQRAKQVFQQIIDLYKPHPAGGMQLDRQRVYDIVKGDPDGAAYMVRSAIENRLAGNIGWGIWMVVANVYDEYLDDDSLSILVQSAASAAGESLPSFREENPPTLEQPKLLILEMVEADLDAGDAHRLALELGLDRLTSEEREAVWGNCVLTFPSEGDARPVPLIPRVRRFMANLHERMPYFPAYLNLEATYGMRLLYFACLADEAAIQELGAGRLSMDASHPSVLRVMAESLRGIRDVCGPRRIDWSTTAKEMMSIYPPEICLQLLSTLDEAA